MVLSQRSLSELDLEKANAVKVEWDQEEPAEKPDKAEKQDKAEKPDKAEKHSKHPHSHRHSEWTRLLRAAVAWLAGAVAQSSQVTALSWLA